MDIYLKRRRGKILLLIAAVLIGIASLLYTNWLTKKMALEESKKVELWAEAIKLLSNAEVKLLDAEGQAIAPNNNEITGNSVKLDELENKYLSLLGMIALQNTTIPVIITRADGSFNMDGNIKYNKDRKQEVLKKELEKMKDYSEPFIIKIPNESGDFLEEDQLFVYYRESNLLRNLRFYPVVQLFVIMVFIVVAYFAFSATQRAEQNQVWVGMSKETAHQLGTPISSLMAWIEILKLKGIDPKLVKEFEKDTERLERITERFSKIGSKPELMVTNVADVLHATIGYLKTRSSGKVIFDASIPENEVVEAPLNAALFSWVIENIAKNAIDAMGNDGKISIDVKQNDEQVTIDISDTGKGVNKSQFKTIFQPGYSTKKRGWGLGLSLAKRIIENYHNGKIFIKWSEIGKGTMFRIVLNK